MPMPGCESAQQLRNPDLAGRLLFRSGALFTALFCTSACTHPLPRTRAATPAPAAVAATATPPPEAARPAASPAVQAAPAVAAPIEAATSPTLPPVASSRTAPGAVPAKPAVQGTKTAERPRPAVAPVTPVAPVAPAAAQNAKPAAAPTLDLTALEQRLRDTHAVGLFTKLSLKNQVDDLLDRFRALYRRQASTPLASLRQQYDLLLMKVLTLLQDGDPPLAAAIASSREAIWSILADPQKFANI
jgi:hypothetical protein